MAYLAHLSVMSANRHYFEHLGGPITESRSSSLTGASERRRGHGWLEAAGAGEAVGGGAAEGGLGGEGGLLVAEAVPHLAHQVDVVHAARPLVLTLALALQDQLEGPVGFEAGRAGQGGEGGGTLSVPLGQTNSAVCHCR